MPQKINRAGAQFESGDMPPDKGFYITPSDEEPLPEVVRAIYIGTSGDLDVKTYAGDRVTYKNLIGGTTKIMRISQVFAVGTTAGDLIGEV